MEVTYSVFAPASVRARIRGRRHPHSWWSWSPEVRPFLDRWARVAPDLPDPIVVNAGGQAPYGATFSLRPSWLAGRRIVRDLRSFAQSLLLVRPEGSAMLLTGVIGDEFPAGALHKLMAAARSDIVRRSRRPSAAMHAPILEERSSENAFSPHCDLYRARILWNVFDDVPSDGSGAATLVPTDAALASLVTARLLTVQRQRRSRELLDGPIGHDSFHRMYRLLYGGSPAASVEDLLFSLSMTLPTRRGDGYIVDDRRWLHGRRAASTGISGRRLHRLIFG